MDLNIKDRNIGELFKKYIGQIKEFWQKMTKKAKIIFFSVIGLVVALAVFLVIFMNRTQYVVLYPNLEQSEAQEICQALLDRGVAYKYDEQSKTISIDSTQEETIRMEFANLGYPQTTLNYDFFTTNVGVMTTEKELEIIQAYGLQDRIGDTIKTINGVNDAIVTLNVATNSDYVWDDSTTNNSTASVKLTLADGVTLNPEQVSAIKKLVSKSVPNLSEDNVAVVDNKGNELSSDSGDATSVSLTEFKLDIEQRISNELTPKIKSILSDIFGPKNVSVVVNADVNLDNIIRESVTYIPASEYNTGVLSHSDKKTENQTKTDSEGGVVGTETNSEATSTTTYENVTDGNTIYSASDESYDYLVSQVTEQVQKDAATKEDLTVAVAVNWPVMDDATKANIQDLVAKSASVDPDKVSVTNMSFYTESTDENPAQEPFQGMLKWVIIAAAGALLLAIIVIVIVVSVKKAKKKKAEKELEGQMDTIFGDDGSIVSTGTTGNTAPIEAISTLRETQSTEQEQVQKEIQEFAGENPAIVASLIRQWLRGEDA